MLNWLKSFFVEPEIDPELLALIERYEAEMLAKEQLKFMQFTVAISSKLFPGDNAAVDRVERAIKDALVDIQ